MTKLKPTRQNYVDNKEFFEVMKRFKLQCKLSKLRILKNLKAKIRLEIGKSKEQDIAWAIEEFKGRYKDITSKNLHRPQNKDYEFIGHCILKIAKKLSNSPNFISYSYKEEMIQDGIMDAIKHIENFDPFYQEKVALKIRLETEDMVAHYNSHGWPEVDCSLAKKPNYMLTEILYREQQEDRIKKLPPPNPFAYVTQICWYAAVRRITSEAKQKTIKSELIKNSGILNNLSDQQDGDDENYTNSYLQFLQENLVETKEAKDKEKSRYRKTTKDYQRKMKDLEEREKIFVEQNLNETPEEGVVVVNEDTED